MSISNNSHNSAPIDDQDDRCPINTSLTLPYRPNYLSFYDYVLKYGKHFPQRPTPIAYRSYGTNKQSAHGNAYRLASDHPELRYAEGFVVEKGRTPLLYAWCVDVEGMAIDPTCDSQADFYGMIFDLRYVWHIFALHFDFGILDARSAQLPFNNAHSAFNDPDNYKEDTV